MQIKKDKKQKKQNKNRKTEKLVQRNVSLYWPYYSNT